MAASASGRIRLAIVGEPIVAVDLINTVAVPGSAVTNDLLSAERSALRDVIEALVADRPVPQGAVSGLNFFTHSAPASTRLRLTGTGLLAETHWHGEYGGNPRLAFIATQAAAFLSDPSKVSKLRRCANPACSMIFIAVNPRRSWCTPGVCGNRVRVARHHRRGDGT